MLPAVFETLCLDKLSEFVRPKLRRVFDLEADDLLPGLTVIHCGVVYDLATDSKWRYGHPGYPWKQIDGTIEDLILKLIESDEVWGHNIISYDIPALDKLHSKAMKEFHARFDGLEGLAVMDSMVICRVIWSDIASMDYENLAKGAIELPGVKGSKEYKKAVAQLVGSHSLRAWGYRLGYYKGNAEGEVDFAVASQEMLEYCDRDIMLNVKLIRMIEAKDPVWFSLWLEHQFYVYLEMQQEWGVGFDVKFANFLCDCWDKELEKRVREMKAQIPDILMETKFVPKVNNAKLGYQKGVPFTKKKIIPFNPRSNDHIIGFLVTKHGWEPSEFTKNKSAKWPQGKPQVTYEILKALPYPEAPLLARIKLLMDRIGLVRDEKSSWLNCVSAGRIHGRIIHNGTPTARCRHMAPNLGNIPAPKSVWGKPLRKCFSASEGNVLVGTDFDSLEMACLAEVLYDYDGGAFYEMAFSGNKEDGTDPHSLNRDAIKRELCRAGFPQVAAGYTRDRAKTNFYAYIYGAWPRKLGQVASEGVSVHPGKYTIIGNAVKAGLAQNIKGLSELVALLEEQYDLCLAARKWPHIRLIDGRMVPIRKKSALLNSLLQAMGAILCKLACVFKLRRIPREWVGAVVRWILHVHDETQDEVKDDPKILPEYVRLVTECFRDSGTYFNLRVPVGGTASVGHNWAETH
jgi:DNA polymerase-1